MNRIGSVTDAMIRYYAGDVRRIQHFLKVCGYARAIGELEGLDTGTQQVLEIAALTHDIGIKNSERKYHSAAGNYQQLEGPPEARTLLEAIGIDAETIRRVVYLIAHHHTYHDIQGLDYQILVEADFLVNIQEDGLSLPAVLRVEKEVFRTASGKRFLHNLYDPLPETRAP